MKSIRYIFLCLLLLPLTILAQDSKHPQIKEYAQIKFLALYRTGDIVHNKDQNFQSPIITIPESFRGQLFDDGLLDKKNLQKEHQVLDQMAKGGWTLTSDNIIDNPQEFTNVAAKFIENNYWRIMVFERSTR